MVGSLYSRFVACTFGVYFLKTLCPPRCGADSDAVVVLQETHGGSGHVARLSVRRQSEVGLTGTQLCVAPGLLPPNR